MDEPYYKGFWNWCKEKHPEVLIRFYNEMKKGMNELEKFVEEMGE